MYGVLDTKLVSHGRSWSKEIKGRSTKPLSNPASLCRWEQTDSLTGLLKICGERTKGGLLRKH